MFLRKCLQNTTVWILHLVASVETSPNSQRLHPIPQHTGPKRSVANVSVPDTEANPQMFSVETLTGHSHYEVVIMLQLIGLIYSNNKVKSDGLVQTWRAVVQCSSSSLLSHIFGLFSYSCHKLRNSFKTCRSIFCPCEEEKEKKNGLKTGVVWHPFIVVDGHFDACFCRPHVHSSSKKRKKLAASLWQHASYCTSQAKDVFVKIVLPGILYL